MVFMYNLVLDVEDNRKDIDTYYQLKEFPTLVEMDRYTGQFDSVEELLIQLVADEQNQYRKDLEMAQLQARIKGVSPDKVVVKEGICTRVLRKIQAGRIKEEQWSFFSVRGTIEPETVISSTDTDMYRKHWSAERDLFQGKNRDSLFLKENYQNFQKFLMDVPQILYRGDQLPEFQYEDLKEIPLIKCFQNTVLNFRSVGAFLPAYDKDHILYQSLVVDRFASMVYDDEALYRKLRSRSLSYDADAVRKRILETKTRANLRRRQAEETTRRAHR